MIQAQGRFNLGGINYQQKLPNPVRISFIKKYSAQDKNAPNILPDFLRNNSIINDRCALCAQYYLKSQMTAIADCQHTFCPTCLHKYCIYKIDVMEDVTCPQEGCSALLQQNRNVFAELPSKTKDKFRRNILWKQTIANPNHKLCPSDKCDGVINKFKDKYQCNKCWTKYCKECELIEHRGRCEQNFQYIFKDWKRCPQCKMFIQRAQGCNHMICRCGCQFCYACLSKWSHTHFECKNNNLYFQIDQMNELACWKRLILGILIIICLPFSIPVYVTLWIISIALTSFFGLLVGPVYFYSNFDILQTPCCCPLCPVYMAAGAILGLALAVYVGGSIFGMGVRRVIDTFKVLWCFQGTQIYLQQQAFFQDIAL